MFNEANILIDEYYRPIFVIEHDIEAGDCLLELEEQQITFKLNNEIVGQLDDVAEELMLLVSMQKEVGIIAHGKGEDILDRYTHVGNINDRVSQRGHGAIQ